MVSSLPQSSYSEAHFHWLNGGVLQTCHRKIVILIRASETVCGTLLTIDPRLFSESADPTTETLDAVALICGPGLHSIKGLPHEL